MPFGSLWIPVVVSTVVVFILSSLAHMVLKHHESDYRGLSGEDALREAIRKIGPAPGVYAIPHCADHAKLKEPEMRKKWEDGPVALLTVMRNGFPAMGKLLGLWALLCFFVSFTAAYVARHTLTYGADGLAIMRITGTVAFAGYAYGYVQDSIWKGIPWAASLRSILDAAVYAVATGLVFRLLWPAA